MKTKIASSIISIILLAACGSKTSSTPAGSLPPVQASEVKVTIANFAFDPGTITVATGTTVTWTNNDTASHNITGDDGTWGSNSLAIGDTFSHTFSKPGTFSYHCGVHPSMKGTITVTSP
jgi:plastocyanin